QGPEGRHNRKCVGRSGLKHATSRVANGLVCSAPLWAFVTKAKTAWTHGSAPNVRVQIGGTGGNKHLTR
ncbi:MAG: hypothetical protein WCK86_11560, partial [Planctomycetia bacterium]